jgi:methylated-DNA-[protein]-cysteine S-methyltransferase
MRLSLDHHTSPIGTILTVTDTEGYLRALDFLDHESRMHRLLRVHYGTYTLTDGPRDPRIATALAAYFEGCGDMLDDLPVRTMGTAFQRDVWGALRVIPAGETMSYGALAKKLERPAASRAVGLANGANPVAIVVPCHRVIGSDGALTGYGGGVHRKEWLLAHERRWAGSEIQNLSPSSRRPAP